MDKDKILILLDRVAILCEKPGKPGKVWEIEKVPKNQGKVRKFHPPICVRTLFFVVSIQTILNLFKESTGYDKSSYNYRNDTEMQKQQ